MCQTTKSLIAMSMLKVLHYIINYFLIFLIAFFYSIQLPAVNAADTATDLILPTDLRHQRRPQIRNKYTTVKSRDRPAQTNT